MGQPNPTRNPIDPNPFLTRLKWPIFYPWPFWPTTLLTRPVRFAISRVNPMETTEFCLWSPAHYESLYYFVFQLGSTKG